MSLFNLILSFVVLIILILFSSTFIFSKSKSDLPSIFRLMVKPMIIILFASFSTYVNYLGFSYIDSETSFWVNFFKSLTSSIKNIGGEFRINEIEILFIEDFYYRFLYTISSLTTFSFSILVIIKILFENIQNTFTLIINVSSKKRIFIIGALEEVKVFVRTLPSNMEDKIIIILPFNHDFNFEIHDIKNILRPRFQRKNTQYSIKFENISIDLFNKLYKRNSIRIKINKFLKIKQSTKAIVLFENPNYGITCYNSAKNYLKNNKQLNEQYHFYVRNDFVKDTTYFDTDNDRANIDIDFNKNIFLYNQKSIIQKTFSENFMFNQHYDKYNLLELNKETSHIQYIFLGFSKRSQEILKYYMIRNSFPGNSKEIEDDEFKIKFYYDVFSNDLSNNSDFFSTMYFRELFKDEKLIDKEDYLEGVSNKIIPRYEKHNGNIFDENFINELDEIIKEFKLKSVHFFFVIGLSNDYDNYDATKIIEDFLKRKHSEYLENYTIFAQINNNEISTSEINNDIPKSDNSTLSKRSVYYYCTNSDILNYNNIINDNQIYLIQRLHIAFNQVPNKSNNFFDINTKISINQYQYETLRSVVLILKQKLNLIGFDIKENIDKNIQDRFDISKNFFNFNHESSSVYKDFKNKYFDKDMETIYSEIDFSKIDKIDNYFKFRKKTIRSKLANIEHSRWVSNQIIDLGYIPMKKSHLLDLIEQKTKKIKNNDYSILEIDEEVDEIRRYNISLTDYENITKIKDLIHNYLINNELLEYIDHKKIKVRVDYYFKNFRLMDSLKVLFPFIDEENEDDIKMKNKSEYYIVKKQIETIVKEEI